MKLIIGNPVSWLTLNFNILFLFAGLLCLTFQSFRLLRCDQQYFGAYPDQCKHYATSRSLCLEMCQIAQNIQSHAVRQVFHF